ncbi:hypothetical protein [Nostoc favosum]|uniref:Uncharacterized protein n=1 Tax=Nostoc favosum CHAB5714 TaxID=2780399 RepID=A0ABS8IDI6_9NOSO|nr:hypothetical protein [Nostoc favosum]MCC5602148.1 hypothetical protein [Nostoc favosum CHAB5714]
MPKTKDDRPSLQNEAIVFQKIHHQDGVLLIMTYPTYSQQQLQLKSIARLKQIYSEIGCTVQVSDKRCKDAWITAIADYQATQAQKIAQAAPNEQITAQANAMAAPTPRANVPEQLTPVEISFYEHEYYAGNQLIASISHDDSHLTQRWVVMVNEKEVFRANTLMRCHRFICTHYKDGTLPVQEQEEPCTTGNEIMSQICTECEKFGFEILDDGIYHNDAKLGEVGCTDGIWSFTRATDETQQRIPCDSALDAVWWLLMVETSSSIEPTLEELLDRPFEMLTAIDWELLREYVPVAESRDLVTA